MPGGRPKGSTKLTPELQAAIVESVEKGLFVESTCEANGISKESYYCWLRLAESGDEPYKSFSDAIKKAEEKSETEALAIVKKGEQNWQSNAWFLERRHYRRWGRRDANNDLKAKALEAQLEQSQAEIALLKERLKQLQAGELNEPMLISVRGYRNGEQAEPEA